MLIKNKKKNKEKGFTLIEMLVAMTLFSFVVTVALGALFMILKANEKTKVIKLVVNNLNVALEGMSREIRVGSEYTCSGGQCSIFEFKTKDKCPAYYKLDIVRDGNGKIIKGKILKKIQKKKDASDASCTDGDQSFVSITSSDIKIEKLIFRTGGIDPGDKKQPRVLISIKGTVHRPNLDEEFNIQTTVSQRKIDAD